MWYNIDVLKNGTKRPIFKIKSLIKKMAKLNIADTVALILVIVGALNWGLIGVADFNLVTTIFGVGTVLSKIVYILVGLAAVYTAVIFAKLERK